MFTHVSYCYYSVAWPIIKWNQNYIFHMNWCNGSILAPCVNKKTLKTQASYWGQKRFGALKRENQRNERTTQFLDHSIVRVRSQRIERELKQRFVEPRELLSKGYIFVGSGSPTKSCEKRKRFFATRTLFFRLASTYSNSRFWPVQ